MTRTCASTCMHAHSVSMRISSKPCRQAYPVWFDYRCSLSHESIILTSAAFPAKQNRTITASFLPTALFAYNVIMHGLVHVPSFLISQCSMLCCMFGCTLSVCAFCKNSVVVSSGVEWSCSGGGLWRKSVSVCTATSIAAATSDIFSKLESSQQEGLKM